MILRFVLYSPLRNLLSQASDFFWPKTGRNSDTAPSGESLPVDLKPREQSSLLTARPTLYAINVEAGGEPCIHVHGIVFRVQHFDPDIALEPTHILINALSAIAISSKGKGAWMGCSLNR